MKILKLIACMISLSCTTWADPVVRYAPVAGAPVPVRAASLNGSDRSVFNYSGTTPLFNGTGLTGTKIYGAVVHSVQTGTVSYQQNISVMEGPAFGRLVMTSQGADGAAVSSRGLLLWDKADFLAGSDSPLSFAEGSSLSVDLFRNDGTVRWVIRNGNTYYISAVAVSGAGSHTLVQTGSLQWAAWDPTANEGADFDRIPSTGFAVQAFDDVTAVGLFFDVSRTGQARFMIAPEGFTADLFTSGKSADLPIVGSAAERSGRISEEKI